MWLSGISPMFPAWAVNASHRRFEDVDSNQLVLSHCCRHRAPSLIFAFDPCPPLPHHKTNKGTDEPANEPLPTHFLPQCLARGLVQSRCSESICCNIKFGPFAHFIARVGPLGAFETNGKAEPWASVHF